MRFEGDDSLIIGACALEIWRWPTCRHLCGHCFDSSSFIVIRFYWGKKKKKKKKEKKNMHDVTWWFNVMFSGKFMKRDNLFIHFVRGTIIEIILFRVVKPDKFKYADSVAFPRNRIQEVDRDAFISYIYTYVCNYEADAKWNEVGCIVNTL